MFPSALKSLNDKQRHDYVLQTYVLNKSDTAESRKHKRDIDVIRENHRFLWTEEDEARSQETWETRLARRYYEKLFKEYCIVELARYRENKVALRWRTEAEVISGKGQFQCGTRKCGERDELRTWEVNFAYQEQGERKNALVKLRLCTEHSRQLNYHSKKREVKRFKRAERHKMKESSTKKRRRSREKSEQGGAKLQADEHDVHDDTHSPLDGYKESHNKDAHDHDKSPPQMPQDCSDGDNDDMEPADDVWSKKLEVVEVCSSRETDFQNYLEDLLL